jgi:Fanconi-associated nuclease 1
VSAISFWVNLFETELNSTQLPDKILTPSLLARVKKRYYPSYEFTRTTDIWKSREDLLQYEKALELEAMLREYLDSSRRNADLSGHRVTTSPVDGKGGKEHEDLGTTDDCSPRVRAAQSVKMLFESVYQLWREMITTCASSSEDVDDQARARRGLSRFECGTLSCCEKGQWGHAYFQAIYTRASCKRERRRSES